MSRPFRYIGGVVILVIGLVVALDAYRSLMLYEGRTPEGYKLLTAIPSDGFAPQVLPKGPVLENQSTRDLSVAFGYKVGGIPYSYTMALSFPGPGDEGHATVTARHATRGASIDSGVTRRWDEPRKAYAVALQDTFGIEPAVPSLCIKALIGPKTGKYDLADASLCVAQRDASGACHPETLACGLIRQ